MTIRRSRDRELEHVRVAPCRSVSLGLAPRNGVTDPRTNHINRACFPDDVSSTRQNPSNQLPTPPNSGKTRFKQPPSSHFPTPGNFFPDLFPDFLVQKFDFDHDFTQDLEEQRLNGRRQTAQTTFLLQMHLF